MTDQASTLRRLVSQLDTANGSTRARQIVLSGCKGGVGTTTLAINLAIALRKLASRVLLVDANPLRGDIAGICGLHSGTDLDDVLSARCTIGDAQVVGPAGILVVPRFGMQSTAPGATARQLIRHLDEVSHAFDYVVLDAGSCPLTAEWIWPGADLAAVVTTTDQVAITDAYVLMKTLTRQGISTPLGVAVNRHESETVADDVCQRLRNSTRRFLDRSIRFQCSIPRDPQLTSAATAGRPVVCAWPHAPSAVAVVELARQIAEEDACTGKTTVNSQLVG